LLNYINLFKLDEINFQLDNDYLTEDDEGYLVSKNKQILLVELKPNFDVSHIAELRKFYNDTKSAIDKIKKPNNTSIAVLGLPVHTLKQVEKYSIAPYYLPIIFFSLALVLTIISTLYLIPTLLAYLSLIITTVLSVLSYLLIFNNFTFNDFLLLSVMILLNSLLMNLFLNRILESKLNTQNRINISVLLKKLLKEERNKFILLTFLSILLSSSLLILFNDFYIREVVFLNLNFVFNLLGILIVYPGFIYLFSRIKIFDKTFSVKKYLDFTFLNELFKKYHNKNLLLAIILILFLIPFTYKTFYFDSSFDLVLNQEVYKNENLINLGYKYNPLYPFSVLTDNKEAINTINNFVNKSKIFIKSDNIYKYIPEKQEEKIGLLKGMLGAFVKDDNFPTRDKVTEKEFLKWVNTLEELQENLDYFKDFKTEQEVYTEITFKDIRKINDNLKEILELIDDRELTYNDIDVLDDFLYQKKKENFEFINNSLNIEEPLTIHDFEESTIERYIESAKFVNYVYPFSTIYDVETRAKSKKELNTMGFVIKENGLFNNFQINFWELIAFLFSLLLSIVFVSYLLFRNYKKVTIQILSVGIYFVLHQALFNLFSVQYSFLRILLSVLIFIIFNIVLAFILELINDQDISKIVHLAYKPILISIVYLFPLIFLVVLYKGFSDFDFIPVLLIDFSLLLVYILIFLPVSVNLILHKNFALFSGISGMISRKNLDSYVEKSGEGFSKKRKFRFFSFNLKALIGKYLNDFNNRSREQVLNKLKDKEQKEEGTEKIVSSHDVKLNNNGEKEKKISEKLPKKKLKEKGRILTKSTNKGNKYDFGHSRYIPIHVFETDAKLTIEAEVGEINIYDVDVSIDKDILKIKNSDIYTGTPFERNIAINVDIDKDKIDILIEEGELIITANKIIKEIDKKEDEKKKDEDKKKDKKGEKDKILEELMTDKKDGGSLSDDGIIPHTLNYKVHSEDHALKIDVFLNELKAEDLKLKLVDNIFKIFPSEEFKGHPFELDIILDNFIIHDTIKTHTEHGKLVITGSYRPKHVEVDNIIDENEEDY